MKKSLLLLLVLGLFMFTGCLSKDFDQSGKITVISREEGSGTRGAFIELFGVEQKNAAGEKVDHTTASAVTTSSTGVMLTNVSSDPQAIGYVSMGSFNDTVKGLKIDGVDPKVANIKNGTYKVSRPFNIATKGELSAVTSDFITYILSKEGQKIIEDNGYISAVDNAVAYKGVKPSGKVVVAGSSSVTPVMEKLKEAYLKLNTNATIEIQMSDSSNGMTSAASGICDIGMASRALKDSELAKGLTPQVIALDGIVVIVNKLNTYSGLTSAQVKDIFTGKVTNWSNVNG
ncbi:MAG TPA: substrate-binding domain-containing protein [Bacilli bacterium]|nr:MAG: Phosphate-binding protein PstS 2 precursor [Tenericutes bacterium ADurb.BinA124]HPX84700.1 substrate-binding domain-containing protein [Bacilli bacterium]HQC75041.1 substrate-binding domain-containing protein [Bacilli bacterium]